MESENNPSAQEIEMVRARGTIIHLMVMLEHVTENVIAMHFCKSEKIKEFHHVVLSKEQFGLKMKCAVLWFIIKNHYTEIATANPNFKKEYDEMIDLRNDFAHKKFNANEGSINEFYLQHFSVKENKIKIKQIPVSESLVIENIKKIEKLGKIVIDIKDRMIEGVEVNPE